MPAIELATLLIQAATQLGPQIQADLASGDASVEQQAKLQAAVAAIGFTGPEWQLAPATPAQPPASVPPAAS